ncbi:MAG: hypothetical protein WCK74_02605 [Gemmatimonadaceae bacterium]
MRPPSTRLPIASRLAITLGLGAVAAVAVAARPSQTTTQTTPAAPQPAQQAAQPVKAPVAAPAATAAAPAAAATDSLKVTADSAASDSLAKTDSAAVMTAPLVVAPAPQQTAPTSWPVDPATGQTLVNGTPVVGRVFIMQKVDGLVKIADVKSHLVPEAMDPLPANVKSTYTPAPSTHTRRIRTAMVQATLWSMDNKKSAARDRHYGPSVPGTALGRR